MTVRECITFAAKLRYAGSEDERKQKIENIINQLSLQKCQNTYIGGPLLRGVSGGERKRTSIGVELITDPSVIFLDEPTTGLDSYTSQKLIKILKGLANSGRTVITTIHQPNSEIFKSFDNLMLMGKGKIVYFKKAELSLPHFNEIGFKCPELANPADYFMSLLSKESIEEENLGKMDKETVE